MAVELRTFKPTEEQKERLTAAVDNLIQSISFVVKENLDQEKDDVMTHIAIITQLTLETMAHIAREILERVNFALIVAYKEMQK